MSPEQREGLTRDEILLWLKEENPQRLEELWDRADAARKASVGDEVHLRGLVEISNHCSRNCGYCGVSLNNSGLQRYRMDAQEILACIRQGASLGYGTAVLQAGGPRSSRPARTMASRASS